MTGRGVRRKRFLLILVVSSFRDFIIPRMVELFGKVSLSKFNGGSRATCYNKEIRTFLHNLGWGIKTPTKKREYLM